MKLVMSHAVYFCDHNFVVNCDTIVHFLYVYFYSSEFYIILLGFDCWTSSTSDYYFTLLMSREKLNFFTKFI